MTKKSGGERSARDRSATQNKNEISSTKKSKTKEIAKRESIAWPAWKMTGSFAP
jgi:hypothetical protein